MKLRRTTAAVLVAAMLAAPAAIETSATTDLETRTITLFQQFDVRQRGITGISGLTTLKAGGSRAWIIDAFDPGGRPASYAMLWRDATSAVDTIRDYDGLIFSPNNIYMRGDASPGRYGIAAAVEDGAGNSATDSALHRTSNDAGEATARNPLTPDGSGRSCTFNGATYTAGATIWCTTDPAAGYCELGPHFSSWTCRYGRWVRSQ